MKQILALMLMALPVATWAKTQGNDTFFERAATGGMAEIEVGKLAQKMGASAEVRDFGAMMVKDDGDTNARLKIIAAAKGVNLATELDEEHKAMMKMLEKKSGVAFDQAYVDVQIMDHRQTALLFESEVASGNDADTKAFAREVLPTGRSICKCCRK